MEDAAFSGLAGEVVSFLEPHTEADRAGLLLSFLVGFGAAVGEGPHAIADGSRHPARLNVVLVGRSARARKGTSWAAIRRVLDEADPGFSSGRVIGGLTSGEGLVSDLARRPEGIARSVLIHEPEFARLLRVAARSATLSALAREAWDGGDLAILTRRQPLRVHGANVALLGHVTAEELRRRLDSTEIANGLANRFLLCAVERSKRLPAGGAIPLDELEALGVRVRRAIVCAHQLGVLRRSREAEERWSEIYCSLDDETDGVVGSLTARAEAQMLRLSVAYALLDGSPTIEVSHIEGAKAVWDHCEATVCRVFAETQPDHVVARLLAALQAAGPAGLDGTEQRDLFSRHLPGSRLARARWDLERRGLARTITEVTGGRPRIITRLMPHDQVWSLPSQPSAGKSRDKIDGCIAMCLAVHAALIPKADEGLVPFA
jgi:hypothetical protein